MMGGEELDIPDPLIWLAYVAAARGLIDDVIEPRDTRRVLIRALEVTLQKRERHVPKKHGLSPA